MLLAVLYNEARLATRHNAINRSFEDYYTRLLYVIHFRVVENARKILYFPGFISRLCICIGENTMEYESYNFFIDLRERQFAAGPVPS